MTAMHIYTDGPLTHERISSIKTIADLDELRVELIWVKRPDSFFESHGVGLTRYGALKYLYGETEARNIRSVMRLESSALLGETKLDGSHIAYKPIVI